MNKIFKYLYWFVSAVIVLAIIGFYVAGNGFSTLMEFKGLVSILFFIWWAFSYAYMKQIKSERAEKRKERNLFK